MIGDS